MRENNQTRDFIAKSNERYSNSYDYSKTQYKTYRTTCVITCRRHGDFAVTPYKHLSLSGLGRCPKCIELEATEKFVSLATEKYGGRFLYTKSKVVSHRGKVDIYCTEHDFWFRQTPKYHLEGSGCKYCRRIKRAAIATRSPAYWENKLSSVFGFEQYDYTGLHYDSKTTKVTFSCKEHGRISRNIHNILKYPDTPPCRECLKRNQEALGQSKLIEAGRTLHNSFYDYSKAKYTTSSAMVTITCPEHGDFQQKAQSHLQGLGCRECSYKKQLTLVGGFSDRYYRMYKGQKSFLYLLSVVTPTGKRYKIGISRYVDKRVASINAATSLTFNTVATACLDVLDCATLENTLHKRYSDKRCDLGIEFCGKSEIFNLEEDDVKDILSTMYTLNQNKVDLVSSNATKEVRVG